MIQTFWRGCVPYASCYQEMQNFTDQRNENTVDELWMCEHPGVFTQGLAGKPDHLLAPGDIDVIQTNRGGQVTFHGPGQVVAYPLLDLRRAGYFVKEYVYRLEESVIKTLLYFGITGHRVASAPGIYVRLDDAYGHALLNQRPAQQTLRDTKTPDFTGLGKIAALGIKVTRHCTYHGLSLNVAMDLSPFERINPCGYVSLPSVDLSTMGVSVGWQEAAEVLNSKLITYLAT